MTTMRAAQPSGLGRLLGQTDILLAVGIMLIVGIVMMLVSIVGMMMFGFAAAASVR